MKLHRFQLEPGTLRQRLERATDRALRHQKLAPISSRTAYLEQGGVRFVVRVGGGFTRKPSGLAGASAGAGADEPQSPYLPLDPDLYVADVGPHHVALLNKFPVIDRHLLLVTGEYEEQQSLLNEADFRALLAAMAELYGLGFYNAGLVAGASQPHKHLQLVPVAAVAETPRLPIDPLLRPALPSAGVGVVGGLPFRHAVAACDPHWIDTPERGAAAALERYVELLRAAGLPHDVRRAGAQEPAPYNLLVTRSWMLLVPRSRESFESIQVNALGFAGSLFVRSEREMQRLEALGPMTLLERVAVAAG